MPIDVNLSDETLKALDDFAQAPADRSRAIAHRVIGCLAADISRSGHWPSDHVPDSGPHIADIAAGAQDYLARRRLDDDHDVPSLATFCAPCGHRAPGHYGSCELFRVDL